MFTYAADQSWQRADRPDTLRGKPSSFAMETVRLQLGLSFVADGPATAGTMPVKPVQPQTIPLPMPKQPVQHPTGMNGDATVDNQYEQLSFVPGLDREAVIRFINGQGFLTYMVKSVKINSYLKSLLSLAGILTQNMIYPEANDEIKTDVVNLMHQYIESLREGTAPMIP